MSDTAPHDWYLPRLKALVSDAAEAGFTQDVSVAVITDLINGPAFNAAPVVTADEDWNRDNGEPDGAVNTGVEPSLAVPHEADLGGRGGVHHAGVRVPNAKTTHHYGPQGRRL